jgi:hypothetical protein
LDEKKKKMFGDEDPEMKGKEVDDAGGEDVADELVSKDKAPPKDNPDMDDAGDEGGEGKKLPMMKKKSKKKMKSEWAKFYEGRKKMMGMDAPPHHDDEDDMGDEDAEDMDMGGDDMGDDDIGDDAGDEDLGKPHGKPIFGKKPAGGVNDDDMDDADMDGDEDMDGDDADMDMGDGDGDEDDMGDEDMPKLPAKPMFKKMFMKAEGKKSKKCDMMKKDAKENKNVNEDDAWLNSVNTMLNANPAPKWWDGITIGEEALLPQIDPNTGFAIPEEPKAGEVGFAPQTRFGAGS